jgi:hypothetical protein
MTPHTLRRCFLAATALLIAPAGTALAQTIKPGLWESKSRMSGSPEMEAAMAQARMALESLPPEQRKQMEAMLAKQGVQGSLGKDGETTVRVCMTKEMAERRTLPSSDPNCTHRMGKAAGNQITFAFDCPGRGSGEGVTTIRSQTEFHTVMNMKADDPRAKGMTMKIEGTSRFVSTDCGDVKPPPMPK